MGRRNKSGIEETGKTDQDPAGSGPGRIAIMAKALIRD
jgi:hypothetical protein